MDTRRIFDIRSFEEFKELALETFEFQYQNIPVYKSFCDYLGIQGTMVKSLEDIPFLPIEVFKFQKIYSAKHAPEISFRSSGTTGSAVSSHHVADLEVYRSSFRRCFKKFYGDIQDYCILALLPSYLEREDSSLVFMVQDFIEQSSHPDSGFYLDDLSGLLEKLRVLEESNTPVILIGVTFALLDLARDSNLSLKNTTVIETGGMKGRKKEMVRADVHQVLQNAWSLPVVHSEYGMTELLSQAYSHGDGIFFTPDWMHIMIRDTEDPKHYLGKGLTGGINVIDLANIYSCSFIATQDLGKLVVDGGFEVLGRFDHSDIRGCNLMVM